MKKSVFIFLFLFVFFLTFSQSNSSEAFTFMDIPITGTVKDFASKMEKKGFKTLVLEGNTAKMYGKFVQENVEVLFLPTPKTGIVYSVVVSFPERNTWELLKSDYEKLKNSLSNKYGKPTLDEVRFSPPYYEGDGYEMTAVKSEKTTIYSRWIKDNGEIILNISTGNILMFYIDKFNNRIKEREDNEIINNDI